MTRGGRRDDDGAEGAERRCIVTGETAPKAGLIRFVLDPEGRVVPDLAEKLPGRGMWLTADSEVIAQAMRKNPFARSAKAPAIVPPDLAQMVEAGLAQRLVALIALARKAGEAVAGFEKVKDWLAQGRAKVLLQANDGSDRGKGKLWTPTGGRYFAVLSAEEMGVAFGRDRVIHGALAAGGLGNRVVEEAAKLAGLRKQDGGTAAGKDRKTT